jgi:predicted methyltransferase
MLTILRKVHNSAKILGVFLLASSGAAAAAAPELADVLALPYRSAENTARDIYRHPLQTLEFFGLQPQHSVLEVWPARGWYTEILAPYLKEQGQLSIANFRQNDGTLEDEKKIFWARLAKKLHQDIEKYPEHFGNVRVMEFDPPAQMQPGHVNQYDMVLSFRNSHVWNEAGYLLDVYRALFDVLKPGGTLGLVEHRSSRLSQISSKAGEGYLDEYYVIAVAKQAGFVLVERSEINANPKDTKDYPKGVYALPPTLAMGGLDKAKYLAIGESDRMTLKFMKPATP